MKNEKFGSIMHEGKIVNIDMSNINDLEKISKELEEKEKNLKEKIFTVFKQ